jgi:predicted neutral ceramidase superfamily lipid hydrolase
MKPETAVNASAAIVEAVATGELTPVEAAELSKVVDSYARSLQAVEFEERLSKLEKAVAK